jgi:hypothetical protein
MCAKELKPGVTANVYEDPFTCKKCAGKATLIQRHNPPRNRDGLEYWYVKFQPHEPGDPVVARWINKATH